jgi:hypothetical protein
MQAVTQKSGGVGASSSHRALEMKEMYSDLNLLPWPREAQGI